MLDATYKLKQVNFPLRRVDFLDENRNYHLLSLALFNKEKTEIYQKIFSFISKMYWELYKDNLVLRYIFSDFDQACYNFYSEEIYS